MPAIITPNFRLENAKNFKAAVADANNSVYVFVGKSDKWSSTLDGTSDAAPTTSNTLVDQNDTWSNMIALKEVTSSDVINLVRRNNWTTGEIYTAWDDADDTIFIDSAKKFYVITTEFKVYKCIVSPGTGSTIMPTQTNVNPTTEGDGYTWKYMFTVFTTDASKFLVNSYIPVKTIAPPPGVDFATWYSALSADDQTKYDFQDNSTATTGKIYRYVVTNGGTGYLTPPTVNVYGNGTGAVATATISGGSVTSVVVSTSGAGFNANAGSGYDVAYVTLTGGSGNGAVVRAVLSPENGHGTDPVSELGGFYLGVAVSLDNGSGDFIVNNTFRQIGIIKNPYDFGTTDVANAETLSALKGMDLSLNNGILPGMYITGASSTAKAFVDSYDSDTGVLLYHQNDKTGYLAFTDGESLTGSSTGASGTIAAASGSASYVDPEVEPFSGKILFLENRAPINRSASQIEEVKIIIEF